MSYCAEFGRSRSNGVAHVGIDRPGGQEKLAVPRAPAVSFRRARPDDDVADPMIACSSPRGLACRIWVVGRTVRDQVRIPPQKNCVPRRLSLSRSLKVIEFDGSIGYLYIVGLEYNYGNSTFYRKWLFLYRWNGHFVFHRMVLIWVYSSQ